MLSMLAPTSIPMYVLFMGMRPLWPPSNSMFLLLKILLLWWVLSLYTLCHLSSSGGKTIGLSANYYIHIRLLYLLHDFQLSGFAIVDQNEMERNYLLVKCALHDQGYMIQFQAVIDCNATGYVFIEEDCAYYHHWPLHLKLSRNLTINNGHPVTSGPITHIEHTWLAISHHQEDILLYAMKLRH
jgi:hypothetical protein